MTVLEVVVALGWPVLVFASGLALVDLAQGNTVLRPRALRLGVAYPLGVAFTAGLGYAASHLLGAAIGRLMALGLPLLPIVARQVSGRGRLTRGSCLPTRPDTKVLAAAGLFVTVALLLQALTCPITDWDGRMTWGTQAKFVAEAQSVDAEVLHEARWLIVHPQYPLLLPVAQAMALNLAGNRDDRVFRPLYVAFLPSLALLAWGAARRLGRPAAAFASAQVLVAPFITFATHGGAAGAYSDLPLGCFFGAGLALLAARGSGFLVGLALAAAILTKNEGIYLAGVALAVFTPSAVAARPGRRRQSVARLLAAGGSVALGMLFLNHWRADIPSRFDVHYPQPGVSSLLAALYMVPTLAPYCASLMVQPSQWGFLFWVAPLLLATGIGGLMRRDVAPFAVAVGGACTVYAAAYAASARPLAMASVSWDRFVVHMVVPLLVVLAAAFAETLRAARRTSTRAPDPSPPSCS